MQSNHGIDGCTYEIHRVDIRLYDPQQCTERDRLHVYQPETNRIYNILIN